MKKRIEKKFVMLGSALLSVVTLHAVEVALPTGNDKIYEGDGPNFYQYVERNFEGQISYPWQGGQYGFVRNPVRSAGQIIYQRLHEGIDIQPLRRDARGMPLDLVQAAADGRVVYVNEQPGASNYGRYVVMEHVWDGCPYYSLYAHLNRADVKAGDAVKRGQTLGLLGFTGTGIDQIRAHLHFEINLFLTNDFEVWHSRWFKGEINRNGLYNGLNLSGLDVGKFLVQAHRDPQLTVPAFLAKEEVFYRIKVPAPGPAELVRRYPWLAQNYHPGQAAEIFFLRSGLPVKVSGLDERVEKPSVVWVRPVKGPVGLYCKSYLRNVGAGWELTTEGLRFLGLLGVL